MFLNIVCRSIDLYDCYKEKRSTEMCWLLESCRCVKTFFFNRAHYYQKQNFIYDYEDIFKVITKTQHLINIVSKKKIEYQFDEQYFSFIHPKFARSLNCWRLRSKNCGGTHKPMISLNPHETTHLQ